MFSVLKQTYYLNRIVNTWQKTAFTNVSNTGLGGGGVGGGLKEEG